jgi:Helix-turn-helix domain
MATEANPYVAIESIRPHWDRFVATGRLNPADYPTMARVMREHDPENENDSDANRERVSLAIADKMLTAVGEPHVVHQLYLVDMKGVPFVKRERVISRYASGSSVNEIMEEFGLSESIVRNWLRAASANAPALPGGRRYRSLRERLAFAA